MKRSLKRRLIVTLMGLILLAWGMSSVITGMYASRFMMEQIDRQLTQYSELVHFITQVFARQAEAGLPLAEPWSIEDFEEGLAQPMVIDSAITEGVSPALNVWLQDTLLAVLESSPRFERPVHEGFSVVDVSEDGSHWRVLSRYDQQTGLWLLVGMELGSARRAMWYVFGQAMFPLLLIIPLTIALLYFGVSRGLGPLRAIASHIAKRHPRDLEPVDFGAVPQEIEPLVDSLNALFARLAYTLESEQRFTANAAHELMTPLAAIKTEVQLCQRQLKDDATRLMLERIALRVDRASHTVEQLLTLARIDPDCAIPRADVDLRKLLEDVLGETAHLAIERGLEVDYIEGGSVNVLGNQEALAILLRNLLINAFRYATENSVVRIGVQRVDGSVILEVGNDCTALPDTEFSRIMDRFYRAPGAAGLGAGLGLSIALAICRQHGAHFKAMPAADGSGFCARVEFSND